MKFKDYNQGITEAKIYSDADAIKAEKDGDWKLAAEIWQAIKITKVGHTKRKFYQDKIDKIKKDHKV